MITLFTFTMPFWIRMVVSMIAIFACMTIAVIIKLFRKYPGVCIRVLVALIIIGGISGIGIWGHYDSQPDFKQDSYVRISRQLSQGDGKIGIVQQSNSRWANVKFITHVTVGADKSYIRHLQEIGYDNQYLTHIPTENIKEEKGLLVERIPTSKPAEIEELPFIDNMLEKMRSPYCLQAVSGVFVYIVGMLLFKIVWPFIKKFKSAILILLIAFGLSVGAICFTRYIIDKYPNDSVPTPKYDTGDYVRIKRQLDLGTDQIGIVQEQHKFPNNHHNYDVRFASHVIREADGSFRNEVKTGVYKYWELQKIPANRIKRINGQMVELKQGKEVTAKEKIRRLTAALEASRKAMMCLALANQPTTKPTTQPIKKTNKEKSNESKNERRNR